MATLRVYVATQWNTVLTVHNVLERPAPRASGRDVDYWADVTVDNNGGTPHRCEVSLREAFARVLDPEPAMSTPRFQADDSPRYVTEEQLVACFRAAVAN